MHRCVFPVLLAACFPAFLYSEGPPSEDAKALKAASVQPDGPGLLAYLKKRSAQAVTNDRLADLVEEMGDDDFFKRQRAFESLILLGHRSKGPLQKGLTHADPEIKYRCSLALRDIDREAIDAPLVDLAVVREVARLRPAGAVDALLNFLPAIGDEAVAATAREALAEIGVKGGQVDPALLRALTDKIALKRTGAAVALCRAGGADHLPEVKKLLRDTLEVRLTTAFELAALKDKDAVPVLIAALTETDSRLTGLAEELLFSLAGFDAPKPVGKDEKREKYRQSWEAWWKQKGEKFDTTLLAEKGKVVGHVCVILLDESEVLDLDAANRVRWKVTGLNFPLDLQRLPGDRILAAEYRGHRVTERDKTGKVVWEHKFEEPIVVQRLTNGNTFVANRFGTREVDKDGKEKFAYSPAPNWQLMRARKLPNDEMLLVIQQGIGGPTRFSRVDKTGKEIKQFPVNVATSGGKIDLTPAGTVLIPEMHNNRVVEVDMDGKQVGTIVFDSPVIALALPNGHVIVTSNNKNRAVEFDRERREVWQYKRNTRVTRVVRH